MAEQGASARADADLMRVELTETERGVLVSVAGEVDMLTAHGLRAAADRAISEAGGRPVTIDLNGVLFFGSRGVAALEQAVASARSGNVALRVVIAPGRPARRILELTGLERIFTLCDTVEDVP